MKIHIFGASGSGVTTLGRTLSQQTGFRYADSDDFFWENSAVPFTTRRHPDERNLLIGTELAQHPDWILGGSVINWGSNWLTAFDLAVFLWIPPALRIERLKKREYERYGDVIFLDETRRQLFAEFIDWAAGYDDDTARGRTRLAHENWMKQLICPVLELRGDLTVDERIERILEKIEVLAPSRIHN